MAHIQNTLIKKQLVDQASDKESAILKYEKMVEKARMEGYSDGEILIELRAEIQRVEADQRDGDLLFREGLMSAKRACHEALEYIIDNIKAGAL